MKMFNYLEGKWMIEGKSSTIHEEWTKVNDSLLTCVSFYVKNGDSTNMEDVRLEKTGKDIFYIPTVEHNAAPVKFKLTNLTIAIFSGIFAGLHGIYYRILDFAYGFPFWSRVQDVVIGSVVFLRSNFGSSIMIWALLHGLPFFVGVKIANFLEKKEWLN